ncbi:MAG: putative Ig domain-containing protein [Planctomycetota bacterium]
MLQNLEQRMLMASDWQNHCNALDATNDGIVTPRDALAPINELARLGGGVLPSERPADRNSVDTNGNGSLEPRDALLVINRLDRAAADWELTFVPTLEDDTGRFGDDSLTRDARIAGQVTSITGFDSIEASVNGGPPLEVAHSCGAFVFDPGLAADGSDDGEHTVVFTAKNSFQGQADRSITFTLDTTAPSVTAQLNDADDTGLPGDRATTNSTVRLVGTSEGTAEVQLVGGGDAVVDSNGSYEISDIPLDSGPNSFAVRSEDIAGNESIVTYQIVSTPCDFEDDHSVGLFMANELLGSGDAHPGPRLSESTLPLTSVNDETVQHASALLDQDYFTDLVTLSASDNEAIVLLGDANQNLQLDQTYPSGGTNPSAVVVGNFIGDLSPDIAIGHRDGTLSFLEGSGDGKFDPRPELNVDGLGEIVDLTAADLDGDGDTDLAVSGRGSVTVLTNDDDPQATSAIRNGRFSRSLLGWDQVSLGAAPGSVSGVVQSLGEGIQLVENDSFLVSIQQSITVPESPETISFDLLDFNLGSSSGSIPDAFEVSLLDGDRNSVVATAKNEGTSFFNVTSDGVFNLGSGVTVEGTRVSVDISQLAPETQATLFFDLLGNEPGTNSSAAIANVAISPTTHFVETFSAIDLAGSFDESAGIGHCDANLDGVLDVVVEDSSGQFHVFEADALGGFHSANQARGRFSALNGGFAIGDVVTGNLEPSETSDSLTFSASVGQTLFFDAQQTTGLQTWTLTDPNGFEVFNQGFADHDNLEVAVSGTYTLTISKFLSGDGPYQFQVHDVPQTVTTSVAIGESVAGQLEVPGQQAEFEFVGESGQELFFDATAGESNLEWELIDPTGARNFAETLGDQGPVTLDSSGVYTVVIDGSLDAVGEFGFRIIDVTPLPPLSLDLSTEVNGSIDAPGKSIAYTFDTEGGQQVFFDAQAGTAADFEIVARHSDGTILFETTLSDSGPHLFPASGTHTLEVTGSGDATGSFRFVLWDVPTRVPVEIDFEAPVTGAIGTPGETNVFEFIADQGDELQFDQIVTDGGIQYTLRTPSGSEVFAGLADESVGPLTESGVYTLEVDGLGESVGTYSFRIVSGSSLPTLPPAANVVITEVVAPRTVTGNAVALPLDWIIRNDGEVAIPAGTTIDFAIHLSADSRLDQRGMDPILTTITRTMTDGLAVGESVAISDLVDLPQGLETELQVLVHADSSNAIFEGMGESGDNVGTTTVSVYSAPRELVGEPILTLDFADGDEFPAGVPLTFSGNALAEPGAVDAIFMLDLSGSTRLITGLDANFDGVVDDADDMNSDGRVGDLLDREIGLVLESISRLVATQTDVRVAIAAWTASGIALFDPGESLDLSSDRFNQVFVDPSLEETRVELEQAVRSLYHNDQGITSHSGASLFREFLIGPGNDYDEGLQELLSVLDGASLADQTQVYFFTDGLFVTNEDEVADESTIAEIASRGIRFRAAQVIGPTFVNQLCSATPSPDWCASVDVGTEFVPEVERIVAGINGVDGSSASSVLADRPEALDDVLLPAVHIAGVTVNGHGVQGFDAAGNFFSTVELAEGDNSVTVVAIDSLGNRTQRDVRLVGTGAPLGFEAFENVSALSEVVFQTASLDRGVSRLDSTARIRNSGDSLLRGPIRLVIDRILPPSITLSSPHQIDETGRPYIEFASEIPFEGMVHGEESLPLELSFTNAESTRFEIEYSLYALGNDAPRFDSIPVVNAEVGEDYVYPVNASDLQGDALQFELTLAPDGMSIDASTGSVHWNPGMSDVGTHSIELKVRDEFGGSASQQFQLQVHETLGNRPPLIQSVPPVTADSGGDFRYQVQAFDPDGDTLTFALASSPTGMMIDPQTGEVSWANSIDGEHDLSIVVSDGEHDATQSFVVSVGGVGTGVTAPLILSSPALLAGVGTRYFYLPLAQDAGDGTLSFSLVESPSGMSIDATTGEIEWLPGAGQLGHNTVVLRTENGRGGVATQLFTVDVLADPPNLPPAFSSVPVRIATANELYQYDSSALDQDDDSLSFSVVHGPTGIAIDGETGLLFLTPTDAQIGTHRIELNVDDGVTNGRQTFDLEVRPGPNLAPEFSTTPETEAVVGQTYFYAADATDDADAVRYVLETSPSGMEIDADSGLISFRPEASQIGSHEIVLAAIDERGARTPQAYSLDVGADTDAPSVSLVLSETVIEPGESIEIHVLASDNVSVISLRLLVDGVEVPLDANNRAVLESTDPGLNVLVATATDASGNVGTAEAMLRTIDPSDQTPPEISVTSPLPGAQITYLEDIVGSVLAEDLEFYRVEFARAEEIDDDNLGAPNPAWKTIVDSKAEVSDQVLATLDPSLLNDGAYLIRVVAQDFSGNASIQAIPIDVAAPAKLGEFSVSFTDLSIPLAGIPIEVTRHYSSIASDIAGDFGFGWSLGLAEPNISESVPQGSDAQIGLFGATPFVFGTRVYLDAPDGKRVGFTFEPERTASFFGVAYTPKFVADPGVAYELSVDPITLAQREDGAFTAFLIGFPYNPDEYRLTAPDGRSYEYDQSLGLRSITDTNGNRVDVTQDALVHSSGQSIQILRDALGRISEIVDPAGHSIRYSYDSVGNLVSVTDQAGVSMHYEYLDDPSHYLAEMNDPSGRPIQRTEYDEAGRVAAIVDADGNRVQQDWDLANFSGTYTDGNGNVTELLYDSRGNIVRSTDPLGYETHFEYADVRHPDLETRVVDRRGYIVEREYDDHGNILQIIEAGHEVSPFDELIVTTFSYNSAGQLVGRVDANGNTREWRYDSIGNLIETIDAYGHSSRYAYDDSGRLETSTDFNANEVVFEYADGDQPTRVLFADGTFLQFEYNTFGQLELEEAYEADGSLARRITARYDASGKLIEETIGVGEASSTRLLFYTGTMLDYEVTVHPDSLDENGQLIETPATPTDERKSRIRRQEYNASGYLVRQTNGEGGVTEFRFDANGNQVLLQDPVGNITTWVYDGLNRVTEMRDPHFNEGLSLEQALVAAGQPSGADCENDMGAEHVVLSCYDAEGNVVKTIDRNGRRTEFEFDHAGRPTLENWYDANDQLIRSLQFGYDAVGNLVTATDPNTDFRFSYDKENRLIQADNNASDSLPIERVILEYTYDLQGNQLSTTDNRGTTVQATYDQRHRLSSSDWFGPEMDTTRMEYAYNAADQATDVRRYAGSNPTLISRTERTYAANGQTETLTHLDAFDQVLADYDYDYNPFGELEREVHHGQTYEYEYDLTGQIVETTRSVYGPEQFEYDANGNRSGASIIGTDNRLLADDTYEYEYDGEGNLIARTELATGNTTVFTYDHRNRLVRVVERTSEGVQLSETEYVFDALDRRTIVEEDGESTQIVYSGENAWADFDGAGVIIAHYLFGAGRDEIVARARPGEGTAWHLADKIGSVRDVTSEEGIVVSRVDYGTFGAVIDVTGPQLLDRFLFTGREFDSQTGWYYLRARNYDPTAGRFNRLDPLGFEARDSNLYRYVGNSPLNATDPDGENSVVEFSVTLAFIGVALIVGLCPALRFVVGGVLSIADSWLINPLQSFGGQFPTTTPNPVPAPGKHPFCYW